MGKTTPLNGEISQGVVLSESAAKNSFPHGEDQVVRGEEALRQAQGDKISRCQIINRMKACSRCDSAEDEAHE